jgi:serine/threonine protein kinase
VNIRQGRYTIKHVLKQSEESRVMTAIANDEQNKGQKVVLKRWECADIPLSQRAKDVAYYERATESLARFHHPFVPKVLDRFAEGSHYYMVQTYVDGESIEERLLKFLRPLREHDVISYLNTLLNVLIALEQQRPPLRHYDISPANIIIDQRNRPMLTGFQIPPPPGTARAARAAGKIRTTRKLVVSPYLPIQDKPFDQRTCIYALAATMHHALTAAAPPHYPTYPPVRLLNPNVSAALEMILSRALVEDSRGRYQSYEAMKKDIQRLL